MFNMNRKKSHVSIELNDYVLRALVAKGPSGNQQLQAIDIPLPPGIVQEGAIIDEMALFDIIQQHAPFLGGKKQHVRFFVPDTSVLLKQIEHPADVEAKDLKSYVQMEIGHSIHLPFQEPLVDVHDPIPGDGKAVVYAAPPEEVHKWMAILFDNHFVPEVADIRALSNLRLLEHLQILSHDKTYLISDWSINELTICIYSGGNVEFLRFQAIETNLEDWKVVTTEEGDVTFEYTGDLEEYRLLVNDQVLELDRMMNFFKFSLYKGEKSVDEIVILGDNPLMPSIETFLSDNFSIPFHKINTAVIEKAFPGFQAKHASLLGLMLKEVQ